MKHTIESTLFDCLGTANIERIHTQMIAWLFCQDKSIIDDRSKSLILNGLFKTKDLYKDFSTITEFKNIDLVIETDSSLFILENKLKSSERPNQTAEYEKVANDLNSKKKLYFCYLTLISDKAQSDSWINASYKQLLNLLKANLKVDNFLKEKIFIDEYINTLENLSEAYKDFSKNHTLYKNVFTDGSVKKCDKNKCSVGYNDYQKYICQNQLETIFQRAFLIKLLLQINIAELLNDIDGHRIEISETRGVALIQLYHKSILYEGNIYRVGFQFQGNSIKINFADEKYHQSKSNQIDQYILDKFENHFSWNNSVPKNKGRKNKGRKKAYISMSKRLPKNIWEYQLHELSEIIKKEIKLFTKKADEFEIPNQTVM